MTEAILYDTHMHTPLCKHSVGEPEAYAETALKKGLKGITITCHSPMNVTWSPHLRMEMNQFDQYLSMVERARAAYEGRVDVRLGIESDYFPGAEAWLTELHSRADFDYVIGSVHPQMREYQERYYKGDVIAFQKGYYDHLVMAAESGLFDCLAHPDIVKTVHPREWNAHFLLDHIRASLDQIAATGIAMELNTSGLIKTPSEMNPGSLILHEMWLRNIPVVVGSDSHDPKRVGADFDKAFDLLQEAGYNEVNFFLARKRHTVMLEDARASLRQPTGLAGMVSSFAQKFI